MNSAGTSAALHLLGLRIQVCVCVNSQGASSLRDNGERIFTEGRSVVLCIVFAWPCHWDLLLLSDSPAIAKKGGEFAKQKIVGLNSHLFLPEKPYSLHIFSFWSSE